MGRWSVLVWEDGLSMLVGLISLFAEVVVSLRFNPANTRHSPNAVSMLGQRQIRWASIETTLVECLVFVGNRVVQEAIICEKKNGSRSVL